MNTTVRASLVLGALLLSASRSSAQYNFGRNAVQYRDFHFRVLKTQHFDIFFFVVEVDVEVLGLQLRPKRRPIPRLSFPRSEDPALRHLLLRQRRRYGGPGGPYGGAVVHADLRDPAASAERPPAAHPLRRSSRLRADERAGRAAR